MSRTNSAPQRNLTLPEELERLEQSITLTLQGNRSYTMSDSIHHLEGIVANGYPCRRDRPQF